VIIILRKRKNGKETIIVRRREYSLTANYIWILLVVIIPMSCNFRPCKCIETSSANQRQIFRRDIRRLISVS